MKVIRQTKTGRFLIEATGVEFARIRTFVGVPDMEIPAPMAAHPTIRRRVRAERKARRTPPGMVARTESRMDALKAAYSRVCENESARSKARTVKGGLFA